MEAEKIKDRLVKYEKKYFQIFKQKGKPGFVPDSVQDCYISYNPAFTVCGQYIPASNTIIFRDTSKNVLLHELIHFYLDELTISEIEFLAVVLSDKIRNKISNYDKIAKGYFEYRQEFVYGVIEDRHDFCFFLVSLFLDMRIGYAPGTVYGYGIEKEFAEKGVIFETK